MKQKKSGFTLLELLIVVAILAVLVALAMPFFQDYLNRSRIAAAEADLTSFQKALASYDQLETEMFTGTWVDLIGKYLQDFRTVDGQTAPVDPWGLNYEMDRVEGIILSYGPNGLKESTGRFAGGDDILKTWKPEFFISDARVVGAGDTVEVTFSRKVEDYDTANVAAVTLSAGAPAPVAQSLTKVSDTVCRIAFNINVEYAGGPPTVTTLTLNNAIVSQDGKTLDTTGADEKPDGTDANVFVLAGP